MAEYLEKLRPDRDLQVYFERPSAIAAMSEATASGFTVSGTWRQQFDWCVIEWDRDNVWEHPLFRNLPDGDLSGLFLSYDETRENCLPMDSEIYPTVGWPFLRVWVEDDTVIDDMESYYEVPLKRYAVPIAGAYTPATATFTLQGSVTAGDAVGLAWMSEHHTHVCYATDTLVDVAEAITASVNAFSVNMIAGRTGTTITLTYVGEDGLGVRQLLAESTTGSNGNRLGAYGHVTPGGSEAWDVEAQYFAGGTSPSEWRVALDFSAIEDKSGNPVPMNRVRKMRWTYATDFQRGEFERSEFRVHLDNWNVTGSARRYRVAGPGSRRIENSSKTVEYYGSSWGPEVRGNYSGGTIRWVEQYGDRLVIRYRSGQNHELYLGTRLLDQAPNIAFRVDDGPMKVFNLRRKLEDRLLRLPIGGYGAGEHTVYITHNGTSGRRFWFDFLEVAIPAEAVANLPAIEKLTLATDWDTDHSLAVPAERTAWMIHSLGFRGRVNHYVGALIFYELYRKGHQYASATIDFIGVPTPSEYSEIAIGTLGEPSSTITVRHLNLFGDTAERIAKAFELEFNRGYTAIRAEASGTRLSIYSRKMGQIGESITLGGSPATGGFLLDLSSATLEGGVDGRWTTDTVTGQTINRACRDWSREFCRTCQSYGLDVTAAFSTELEHGDPSPEAGLAQRYSDGEPCLLTTPALQTNFSPTARQYWKRVHKQMADIMAEIGLVPYLQLGEVQWWYFPGPFGISTGISMPYYDQYTIDSFQARYGFPMRLIQNQYVDPGLYPEESVHLPALIGEYTDELIGFVKAAHPNCRYEVLYPTDVNDTAWGRIVNYPDAEWTPAKINVLKTESFSFTFDRNLKKSKYSVEFPSSKGFLRSQSAFLVGPGDSTTTWRKEVDMAMAAGVESIVLFALDQFCLIGYSPSNSRISRRSARHGA